MVSERKNEGIHGGLRKCFRWFSFPIFLNCVLGFFPEWYFLCSVFLFKLFIWYLFYLYRDSTERKRKKPEKTIKQNWLSSYWCTGLFDMFNSLEILIILIYFHILIHVWFSRNKENFCLLVILKCIHLHLMLQKTK